MPLFHPLRMTVVDRFDCMLCRVVLGVAWNSICGIKVIYCAHGRHQLYSTRCDLNIDSARFLNILFYDQYPESRCWELHEFSIPSDRHSHGPWNKSRFPYLLRNRIFPNLAIVGGPETMCLLVPDTCVVESYAVSQWVWLLGVILERVVWDKTQGSVSDVIKMTVMCVCICVTSGNDFSGPRQVDNHIKSACLLPEMHIKTGSTSHWYFNRK